MIILFGWEKKGTRVRPLLDTHCYRCKRQTTWDWYRITEWVTFFFIRVLPFKDEHLVVCANCGDQLLLDKNEARGIKKLKNLAPTESQTLHDKLVKRLEDHQLADKSDTQREFLKSQRKQ
jgi:zinc-ribbon family